MATDYDGLEQILNDSLLSLEKINTDEQIWKQDWIMRRGSYPTYKPDINEIQNKLLLALNKLMASLGVITVEDIPEVELRYFFKRHLAPSTLLSVKINRIKNALASMAKVRFDREMVNWNGDFKKAITLLNDERQRKTIEFAQLRAENNDALLAVFEPYFTKYGYKYINNQFRYLVKKRLPIKPVEIPKGWTYSSQSSGLKEVHLLTRPLPWGYKETIPFDIWIPELRKLEVFAGPGPGPAAPTPTPANKKPTPYLTYNDRQLFVKRPNLLIGGTRHSRSKRTRRATRRQ